MVENNEDDSEAYEGYWTKKRQKFMKSFNKMYEPRQYDVQREDIGGLEAILDDLDRFGRGIEHPDIYEFMGVTPPNGFLLEGKPGTGKTLIGKYLADSLDARFVDMPLEKIESMFVGQAEKKLSEHLHWFRRHYQVMDRKVLVFFDEAEETFKNRQARGYHAPRVNLLLREMDGLGDNEGIIFGGATNHLDRCDPAILRAGRLDFIIKMPEYTSEMLGDVYKATAKHLNRKAPHHDPYRIKDTYYPELGRLAKRKDLVPSDVKEIFRLSAEERIKEVLEDDNDRIYDSRRLIVGGGTLVEQTKLYERAGSSGSGRIIGFDN